MSKIIKSFDVHILVGLPCGSRAFDSLTGVEIENVRNIYVTHEVGRLPSVRLVIAATQDGKPFKDGDQLAEYEMTGYVNSIAELK